MPGGALEVRRKAIDRRPCSPPDVTWSAMSNADVESTSPAAHDADRPALLDDVEVIAAGRLGDVVGLVEVADLLER